MGVPLGTSWGGLGDAWGGLGAALGSLGDALAGLGDALGTLWDRLGRPPWQNLDGTTWKDLPESTSLVRALSPITL